MVKPNKPTEVQVALRNPRTITAGDATIAYINAISNYTGLANANDLTEAEGVTEPIDFTGFANGDAVKVDKTGGVLEPLKTNTPFLDMGYHIERQMTYPNDNALARDLRVESGATMNTGSKGLRFINTNNGNGRVFLPTHPSSLNVRFRGSMRFSPTVAGQYVDGGIGFNSNRANAKFNNFGGAMDFDTSLIINQSISGGLRTANNSIIFFEVEMKLDPMGESTMVISAGQFGEFASSADTQIDFAFDGFNQYESVRPGHPAYIGRVTITGDASQETTITPYLFNSRIYHIDYLAGNTRNIGA